MKRKLLLLPLLALNACFPGGDWATEHLTGRYYVLGNGPKWGETEWHDAQLYFDDEQYSYGEPLIKPNISAVWYDDAFIVAETSALQITNGQVRIDHQYYLVQVWQGSDRTPAERLMQGPLDRPTCYRELARRKGDTLLSDTHRFYTLTTSDFSKR